MKNKTLILIYLIFFLSTGGTVKSQTSLTGHINTTAIHNSIIRTWHDSLIVYAEESNGNGYFHLINNTSNGATVLFIDLPTDIRVRDFKIMDDRLFFVGTESGNQAIAGTFDIPNIFYFGSAIDYCRLSSYNLIYRGFPLDLMKMEVYEYNSDYHIIAIGKSEEDLLSKTPRNNTGIYDIVFSQSGFSNLYTIAPSFDGSIITDVVQTDNYIISLAHKGDISDMSVSGYIMMHPFDKDAAPLQNSSGYTLQHLNTYSNGYIMGTGITNDDFIVSCCSPDSIYPLTLTSQEYITMNVSAGIISIPSLTKKYTNTWTYNNFNSIRDMAYNSVSNVLCDIDDFMASTTVLSLYNPTTFFLEKISSRNSRPNSVCSMASSKCAVSGYNPSGLYILMQELPPPITCESINTVSLTQDSVVILRGNDYYPTSAPTSSDTYDPQITIATFYIDCNKN